MNAKQLVKSRDKHYGKPNTTLSRVAQLWMIYLGVEISK